MTYPNRLTTDEAERINMSGLSLDRVGDRIRDLELNAIGVPLTEFRVLDSDQIATLATSAGGVIAHNTDPVFERASAAAGGMPRISWVTGSEVPIVAHISLPKALDATQGLVVKCRALRSNSATSSKAKGTLYCKVNFDNQPTASAVAKTSGTISATAYGEVDFTYSATEVPTGALSMIVELYRAPATNTACATYVQSCRVLPT